MLFRYGLDQVWKILIAKLTCQSAAKHSGVMDNYDRSVR